MGLPLAPVLRAYPRSRETRAISHVQFLASELVLLILLAALSLLVKQHPGPLPGDVGLERAVQSAILPYPAVAGPVEAVSTLNWPVPVAATIAIIVVLFLLLRRWLDAIVVPLAAGAASLGTLVLSRWVHRPRPAGHGIHVMQTISSSFSFPSGHVEYAVAIYGLLFFLTFQVRRKLHPALIWTIRVILVSLILLMPISRMTEGEHWPSDILGAVLDGLFWLVLFAHAYLWARVRRPGMLARDER